MSIKKVFCYNVRVPDHYDFTTILCNPEFHKPVGIGVKKIEIDNLKRDSSKRVITGIFVCTQTRDIPPAHKPGDSDYSAVPLGNGQGLAYPNAFLYCEQTKVLLMEFNMYGVTIKNLIEFFGTNAAKSNILDWEMGIEIILTRDAYERARNLTTVKEITVQVATPHNLVTTDSYNHGSLEDIALLAKDLGATRSISVTFKGEYVDGGLSKTKTLGFMDVMNRIGQRFMNSTGMAKNSLIVTGTVPNGDGQEREEAINFFIDRLESTFELEDKKIHANLQPLSRKNGMDEVYNNLKADLKELIGIRAKIK